MLSLIDLLAIIGTLVLGAVIWELASGGWYRLRTGSWPLDAAQLENKYLVRERDQARTETIRETERANKAEATALKLANAILQKKTDTGDE